MKYISVVFLGFAIFQAIAAGHLDGVNNAFASAASSASAFMNGQGSNQFIPNGPSTSGSASARKNDISIDVDISQKQQGNNKNNLGFNGFNGFNQFNAGNMNEQEMHRHFSQYLQNMNGYGGSNQGYPAAQHGGHSHGHHQSGNNKNDISIDLDISTNSKNQKVGSHGLPPQHGQNGYGLGFAASNGVDGINPAAPAAPAAPGVPGAQGILGNALGSVGSAASSLKDKLWGSKQTPPGSPSKDGEQKISLDIDLDTDGDGKADQKINVDIDQKDKDINRERNKLKSDHEHMNEHDKGLKLKKKEKKQKIKNQKNKHVSNMSWSTTTNHYHPGQNPAPPSVVQIHLPPPMAMHHYNYPPPPPYHNAPPPMPSTITHNSMNAAASSLSLQSTTVPSGPYANSHAAQMPGYGHGPSPPTAFYGQSNAVSGMNGIPNGVGAYGHADAAVNMQQGVPSYGNQHLKAPPSSYNHLNQVPNMQAPYNNNGVQNLYGQAPSAYHQQPQMGHQYSQTPYHH